MTNNDILQRVRYALDLNDPTMLDIFNLAGYPMDPVILTRMFKKDDEEGFYDCKNPALEAFLDGIIIRNRGPKEGGNEPKQKIRLTNNLILKKLRIALELKEEDMLAILKLADSEISKSELSALFRKEGHKNYKECGDQFLRIFLRGLAVRYRG